MQPWKRLEPTEVTKVGWRTIVRKNFVRNDGIHVDADTVGPEGARHTAVIALTTDNQVVVAASFRVGPEKVMLEIPGGTVEDGEEPEMAATRELREEAGYEVGSIEYLGKVYKDAWHNAEWHYFIARDCVPCADGQDLDDFEEITPQLISVNELIDNARTANMTDIDAVFLAYEKLKEIQNEQA